MMVYKIKAYTFILEVMAGRAVDFQLLCVSAVTEGEEGEVEGVALLVCQTVEWLDLSRGISGTQCKSY